MARKGTVEKALSANELHDFCERLAAMPNLTLGKMQKEAKKLGITLSHSAAGRFANGTFAEHLRRLKRAREFADQVEAFNASGAAGSLADTAAATILQDICDLMASGEEYNISKIAQAVSTLQAGEHRRRELSAKLRESELRVEKLEREKAEREAAKEKALKDLKDGGGLSDEAIARIEQKLSEL